jgi:DNA-binding response OmpR family regulator
MSQGSPGRPLRILIVDDDPAMVGAISALVGLEGHQVITAYDGLTAVRRYRDESPDIVLLDLAMSGPDGFSVISRIRGLGGAPIIVVSGESGEAAKVRALGLGADDYLTKPFGRQELLARIGAVVRRAATPAHAGPASAGPLVLDPGRHEARIRGTILDLTPTEYRLLEALLRAGGDVVPHLQLARAGWPGEADPDVLWLKPHIARLRGKVTAAGGPSIVAIRGVGYRLRLDGKAGRPDGEG